jgi:hypothetical protein
MCTWLVELRWSRRRSQHRGHGHHLRSGTCGRVNSIAETLLLQRAVLEHSKFGIKAFFTSDPGFYCMRAVPSAPFQAPALMFTAP